MSDITANGERRARRGRSFYLLGNFQIIRTSDDLKMSSLQNILRKFTQRLQENFLPFAMFNGAEQKKSRRSSFTRWQRPEFVRRIRNTIEQPTDRAAGERLVDQRAMRVWRHNEISKADSGAQFCVAAQVMLAHRTLMNPPDVGNGFSLRRADGRRAKNCARHQTIKAACHVRERFVTRSPQRIHNRR